VGDDRTGWLLLLLLLLLQQYEARRWSVLQWTNRLLHQEMAA